MIIAFIDQHRDVYGVEPICALLPIAPSTYFLRTAQVRDAARRSARARRDAELCVAIRQVWDANDQVYGPRKDWFNTRRLLEPIGYVPPAEYEATYYADVERGGAQRPLDPSPEVDGTAAERPQGFLPSVVTDQTRGTELPA